MDSSQAAIAPGEFRARQAAALAATERAGLDALLVVSRSFYDRPGDIAYLTNHFPPFPNAVFDDEAVGYGHAVVLLTARAGAILLTDTRGHREDLVTADEVRPAADLARATAEAIAERGLSEAGIAFVGDDVAPAAFTATWRAMLPGLTLTPSNRLLHDLRAVKSEAEIALLRAASRCAGASIDAAVAAIGRAPLTEREVGAAGGGAALAAGADFIRYFRVHSGPWAERGSRWPPATERTIAPGEIVVLDSIGARQGYAFDMNRTVVAGSPTADARALLEAGHRATEAAVAACVAGATAGDVVRAAALALDATPFGSHFRGSAGHGIGIETVETPYLRAGDATPLRPGMALCVEPSVFVPGLGGVAIEQTVIVRPEGPPEIVSGTPTRSWPSA